MEIDAQGQRYIDIFRRYVRIAAGEFDIALKFFNMMHPQAWSEHPTAYEIIIREQKKKRA